MKCPHNVFGFLYVEFDAYTLNNIFPILKHTERTLHTFNGTIRRQDTGFFMLGMDRNTNHYVIRK